MTEESLHVDREYEIKVGSQSVFGYVKTVNHKIDVNTLDKSAASQLDLNEIGNCHFTLNERVQFDAYETNRLTGAFIIIDRLSNVTVGAGMIAGSLEADGQKEDESHSAFEVEFNALVRKHFPHWGAKKVY